MYYVVVVVVVVRILIFLLSRRRRRHPPPRDDSSCSGGCLVAVIRPEGGRRVEVMLFPRKTLRAPALVPKMYAGNSELFRLFLFFRFYSITARTPTYR